MGGIRRKSVVGAWIALLICLAAPGNGVAQLKGHYFAGFTGLQNGTQPPPGLSLFTPLYFYTAGGISNSEGVTNDLLDVNAFFTGLGFGWVTTYKVLGGNLGGSIVPIAFIKSRLEAANFDVPKDFAFTDISLQPAQLGWHTAVADFLIGYTLFMPTGKYVFGGTENSGLGMWSHLFQAGFTYRFDTARTWSFSTLGSYELHSKKKDRDIRVGQIATLEGGLDHTWYVQRVVGGALVPTFVFNVGGVYYWQFKATDDEGPLLSLLEGGRDRVFGLGWETNAVVPTKSIALGFRALFEMGARNRPEGWTFLLSASYLLKALQ